MKRFRLTELLWIVTSAILIWLVVLVFNARTVTLDIPITITGLEPTLAISENLTTIKVSAQIKFALISGLKNTNNISATIDVSELNTEGKYVVMPEVKATLPEIKIISFSPKSLDISIVPRVSRIISLRPQTSGFVASGFTTGTIALSPDIVSVSGPESIVSSATYAIVPIKLNGQTVSFVSEGEPEMQSAAGQKLVNLTFLPKVVAVSVEIKRGSSFKAVGLRPTFSGSLPDGYWVSAIEFNPQALTIKGDGEKIAGIDTLATTSINLKDRYTNFQDKVAVELPVGVELLEPNLIEISIKISTAINNRELNLIPKYVNVTAGFGVSLINPNTITVVISGPPEKLAILSRANVSLDLDLRGALSGLNKIDLTKDMFKTLEGTEVVNFTPNRVEVTLTKS